MRRVLERGGKSKVEPVSCRTNGGDLLLFAYGHSTSCFIAFRCIDDDCWMPLGSTVYRARVNSRAKRLSHQKQLGDGKAKEKGREQTERQRERERERSSLD
jgi:hypothetical protein